MTSATARDLWLRRFHAATAPRARLVCFPHAGGSATFYFPVAAELAPAVEVLGVQYPGRHDRHREPLVDDIRELAGSVHSALPADGVPTALLGHSMGAVVAFETARLMERDVAPAHLFVSGRRAPSVARSETRHLLGDDALVADLQTLDGTDGRVFTDEDLLRMALPAIRNDYRAAETYTWAGGAPLGCDITAFTGDADPRTDVEDAAAWQHHTTGAFALSVHRGGHFFIASERGQVLNRVRADLGVAL
ncbi:alpha/beta fold hydrolase [Pseudonocardia sp. DSM 110487]|uniref:thioesterase II family protein n=1 Tax=Pseudonocardia sp. DSM 110487 TaxID=2865833 RepID=UPI001C6978A8|nr:alpha/beta fold hydrolase [Pseudonocardia sp. DSM 110487]QYN33623.1 alpha/beta fold hydrolase [Pseudonocardia sp. DSM 110487]